MRIIKTLRSNSKKIKIYNRELFLKIKKINNISTLPIGRKVSGYLPLKFVWRTRMAHALLFSVVSSISVQKHRFPGK